MKYLFLLLTIMIIFFLQARPLVRNKYYKDLAVYIIMLLAGTTGVLLQMAGVDIPSPAKGIELVVKSFVTANFSFK